MATSRAIVAVVLALAASLGVSAVCDVGDPTCDAGDDVAMLQAKTVVQSAECDRSPTTFTPTVGSFSKLEVFGHFDVSLVPEGDHGVEVKVDSGLKDYVEVSVADGTLSIKWASGMPCDRGNDPEITVTSPEFLTSIHASSHAKVNFPKWPFELGNRVSATVGSLELTASSHADIEIKQVKAESIAVTVDSNAQVDLEWTTADKLDVSARSNGEVQGGTYGALAVSAHSNAQVEVTVTGSATGVADSNAYVKLCGLQQHEVHLSGGQVHLSNDCD